MAMRWQMTAVMAVLALVLTGCTNEGEGMATPTGDELFAQAKQHYLDYRDVTNSVQGLIFDGPWEAPGGSFGMEPSGAGCPDGSYKFSLARSTEVDPEQHAEQSAAVQKYLTDAGYELAGMDLGSGEVQSSDVIVREQGEFSLLTVTFITNGNVLVTATTKCRPGDRYELGDLMFGDANLSEGYLPREESPSDPLFFGVTPGEPAFGPTPKPTATP
ncbi:hypothetical protein [Microbacterium sp. J1-1]|uniref:hypothetical protein n=1 Tax=Microbacterium sp. J1-1 TaxID=2992441 RepID=UPI0021142B80|nr:hypothetical protein [Microbacterium sp. J1-1]UUE21155.1 hypothetical protein LRQ07_02475 [Microbacterium sp. J1-1]